MASAPSCVADISIREPEDRQLDEGGGGGGRETSQQLYWMAIQFGRPNNLERAPMGAQGCGMVMVKGGYFSEDIMVSIPSSKVQVF